MLPGPPKNNPLDVARRDTVQPCQHLVGASRFTSGTNIKHLPDSQFCRTISFAWESGFSAFFNGILLIFHGSSFKQVSRIATRFIVALVANKMPGFNWPKCQRIGKPMSGTKLIACLMMPVTIWGNSAFPIPAIINAFHIHFGPENRTGQNFQKLPPPTAGSLALRVVSYFHVLLMIQKGAG